MTKFSGKKSPLTSTSTSTSTTTTTSFRNNPFDRRSVIPKFSVLGRVVKGTKGNPSVTKSRSLSVRKNLLLTEYKNRFKTGAISDGRFGQKQMNNLEDGEGVVAARFAKEKQRRLSRKDKRNIYNLNEPTSFSLTHSGRNIDDIDDFSDVDPSLDDMLSENEQIDRQTVQFTHFGGFADSVKLTHSKEFPSSNANDDGKKKGKTEIMKEVIAKSKFYKYQRQREKEENEDLTLALNADFDSIRSLLNFQRDVGDNVKRDKEEESLVPSFDATVNEMLFESKKASAAERTKTEIEIAQEEREKLEKLEKLRMKRMKEMDSDNENTDDSDFNNRNLKKKRQNPQSADSLDVDFEDDVFDGSQRDDVSESNENEESDEEDSEDEDEEEDSDSGDELSFNDDSSDVDADGDEDEEEEDKDVIEMVTKSAIPFSFAAPKNHEELLALTIDGSICNILSITERMKKLYHPSLAQGNKQLLSDFSLLLLDHLLWCIKNISPSASDINALIPILNDFAEQYNMEFARHFMTKLKNISKYISTGKNLSLDKSTLFMFTLIGHFFSTSDYYHTVVTPAQLLMAQYLGAANPKTASQLAAYFYLTHLLIAFQKQSKRYIPEVICFLSIYFENQFCIGLGGPGKEIYCKNGDRKLSISQYFFIDSFEGYDFGMVAIEMLDSVMEMYSTLPAFIDIFKPVIALISRLQAVKYEETIDRIKSMMEKMLSQKREVLYLQKHKPLALPTLAPDFNDRYSLDSYRKRNSLNEPIEEAETKKLNALVKKEKKGAIRELKRDAAFLASQKIAEKRAKDLEYNSKIKKIYGMIGNESNQ